MFNTIRLGYPIDIKNIKPKELTLRSDFSSTRETVYDVTAFSSIRFHLAQYSRELARKYPEYQYKIYAWRSTLGKNPHDTTIITRVRLTPKVDSYKKFIHVSVELLPQVPFAEEGEPEEPEEEHLEEESIEEPLEEESC